MLGSVTQQKRRFIVQKPTFMRLLMTLTYSGFFLSHVLSGPEEEMILLSPSQLGRHHGRQKEGTMARNLSKCVFVFLILALSGLIFLLRNIHSVEVRRGSTAGPVSSLPRWGLQPPEGTEDMQSEITAVISPCRAVMRVFLCQVPRTLWGIYAFSSSLLCRT